MSSITAQQTKLDLELVSKEKRLEIEKCNIRLNPGKKQREPTFQVVLDALALTSCYSAFLTTTDVLEVYMHQFWDSIHKYDSFLQNLVILGISSQSPMLLLIRCINLEELLLLSSTEFYLERHPVLISFVFLQLKSFGECNISSRWTMLNYYGKISLTRLTTEVTKSKRRCTTLNSPKLSFNTSLPKTRQSPGETRYASIPPGMSSDKHFKIRLLSPKEPTRKSKRVKRPTMKSTNVPTAEAQYKEVRKKSLRDFHKTNPSGSVIVTSAAKIKPLVTNEGTGRDDDNSNNDHDSSSKGGDQESDIGDDNTQSDKEKGSNSEHETVENETGSKSDQEENKEEVENKAKGDEDKGMDYTTNQLDDDVDVRLNEPVNTDEGFIQKEGTDAKMINRTEVPVTSFSHSSDLASKFLIFLDIPHIVTEIVSPMDVHVHHEVPSNQTPTLLTIPISVITESSPIYTTVILQSLPSFTPPPPQSTPTPPPITEATNPLSYLPLLNFCFRLPIPTKIGATRDEFISYLSASITARITEQVTIQLPQILPNEVSNFAPLVIKSMVTESLEHAVLAKESSQPQSTYEATASLTEFELKKILIDKIDEMYSLKRSRKYKDKDEDPSAGSDRWLKKRKTSKDAEPTKGPKTKEPKSGSSKGTKSQSKSFRKSIHSKELEFEVADSDIPPDQEENMGNDDEEPKRKDASKLDWFPNLNDLKNPLILIGMPAFKLLKGTRTNFAELEYDFEECYKALSEKLDWDNPESGDYPFDLTKHLPLVMNGNRQIVSVDYFFNNNLKYLQGGILTITYMAFITKTEAAQYDLQGIEDMVKNLWMTRVEVMQKHGYRYLREIEVQRSDNELHTFKEGDFPRLRINDIEDMLILHGYLKESRRSLGVESYQKKINVTKLETTRPDIRKRDPYTPYQDPQGFIYVNNKGRNKLMRLDELYKFSDGTLTRLRTLLDDITKNI
ncbi:hypothetical protein Tco_1328243 [Tanacetum coccineum]